MKWANLLIFILLFSVSVIHATEQRHTLAKSQVEKELEVADFSSIKDVLKEDHLVKNVEKKIKKVRQIKQKRLDSKIKRFDVPSDGEFWRILSEYWVVKNVAVLKWNFKKPHYGIEDRVIQLFKQVGLINISFKILLLNTSMITHLYLPYGQNHLLSMLSVPFIRSMNLSRLEIALLILEDYVRSTLQPVETRLIKVMGQDYLGKNFYNKRKMDLAPFQQAFHKLDTLAFEEGFSFKEQFAVTKKMKMLLAGEDKLQRAYKSLLHKIILLVEQNPDYKNYVRFYPSPSIQVKWFVGKTSGN